PRVVNVDLGAKSLELAHEISHFGVAQIRTVFLERQPHDQDARTFDVDALLNHQLRNPIGYVERHVVIDTAAGEDHLWVIADLLRLVREVVRIHSDAMATHQPRPEWQEIPLGSRSLQDLLGVDAKPVENQRQLIDERNVDIALCILDDLGCFGYANTRDLVRSRLDDAPVERIDKVRNRGW